MDDVFSVELQGALNHHGANLAVDGIVGLDALWEHQSMFQRPIDVRGRLLSVAFLAFASIVGACGDEEGPRATPLAHPALECGSDGSGVGNYDLIGPGFETAEAAIEDRLSYYQDLYGGEIVDLPGDEGALRVVGAVVVVATATAASEGGFLVQEDYYCARFGPQQSGSPATEPAVTVVP